MGDRVSVSFRQGKRESVALFAHWGGPEFPDLARKYLAELDQEVPVKIGNPLTRREPEIIMVDFIVWLYRNKELSGEGEHVSSSFYLGKDQHDGDNSDNGHHVIDLEPSHTFV